METKDFEIVMDKILNHPEDVLRELGRDGALQLIRKLSATPTAAKVLEDCELMKMIESGRKIITGKILQEEADHE